MNSLLQKWNQFWFCKTSPHELGFYRFIFFAHAAYSKIWHIDWTLLKHFNSQTWKPFNPIFSSPPRIEILLEPYFTWILSLSILFSAVGLFTRFSVTITAILSSYYFLLWGSYQHSGHIAQIMCLGFIIFSLSPCGEGFSLDWVLFRRRVNENPSPKYGWVRPMLLLLICLEYFSAGLQKWIGAGTDWFLSNNLALTINARCMRFNFTPEFVCGLSPYETLLSGVAFLVFSIELLSPMALFSRRFRPWILIGLFTFQFLNAVLMKIHGRSANFPILLMFLPWKIIAQSIGATWKSVKELKPRQLEEHQSQ